MQKSNLFNCIVLKYFPISDKSEYLSLKKNCYINYSLKQTFVYDKFFDLQNSVPCLMTVAQAFLLNE